MFCGKRVYVDIHHRNLVSPAGAKVPTRAKVAPKKAAKFILPIMMMTCRRE